MRWTTRAGVHIDRAACAWLVRRYGHLDAECLVFGVVQRTLVTGTDRP